MSSVQSVSNNKANMQVMKEHSNEIKKIRADHYQKYKSEVDRQNLEINRLRDEQESFKVSLQNDLDKEIQELRMKNKVHVAQEEEKFAAFVNDMKQIHQDKVNELKMTHEKELNDLNHNHDNALKNAKLNFEKKMNKYNI